MTKDADRAIELLAELYIMCNVAADFSNGVTHNGVDEGQVLAGRFLNKVGAFLKGKSRTYDEYTSRFVQPGEVPFEEVLF